MPYEGEMIAQWKCRECGPPLPPMEKGDAPIQQPMIWHREGDSAPLGVDELIEDVLRHTQRRFVLCNIGELGLRLSAGELITNCARYGFPVVPKWGEEYAPQIVDPAHFDLSLKKRHGEVGFGLNQFVLQAADPGNDFPGGRDPAYFADMSVASDEGLEATHGRGIQLMRGFGYTVKSHRIHEKRKLVTLLSPPLPEIV